jgi:hypothetical protein
MVRLGNHPWIEPWIEENDQLLVGLDEDEVEKENGKDPEDDDLEDDDLDDEDDDFDDDDDFEDDDLDDDDDEDEDEAEA